jgi:hypothetical protein
MWETMATEAARESRLWARALRPNAEREQRPVFSPLAPDGLALGIETIYEGYLLHYGRPRLFAPENDETALLLGDYLYAHGLVRVAASRQVAAVADLAELISLCAQCRGDRRGDDAWAWAATVALVGSGRLDEGRRALRDRGDDGPLARLARGAAGEVAVERAIAAHRERVR